MEDHHLQNHNGPKQASIILVMVPFPSQSHLNQLLQLSCTISSYNIPVHYVGSATHNLQVNTRANGLNPLDLSKIQFHDFPIPPFPSPPPDPNAKVKFPSHLMPSFTASLQLRDQVAALLKKLSPEAKRIIIIHDSLMASVVQDASSVEKSETYAFQSISAFGVFFSMWEAMGRPLQIEAAALPTEVPSLEGCYTYEIMNFIAYQSEFAKIRAGDIYNTSRVLEGNYLELARELVKENKKQWAIGPLNPIKLCNDRTLGSQHECLEWLNEQQPNSVLYISFGTGTSMGDQQIKELAIGLEQSEIKFLWVLRDADKGDVFEGEVRRPELPEGFEERVKGVGMVLRDWVPQLEILEHPSIGGFMSHCGWSSCMESISMGVPIASWPMHSDQPMNAVLVTEILKVGLSVKEWAKRDKLLTSSTIRGAVTRLIASGEGEEMRKRAEVLSGTVRQSIDEGGVSRTELESFIAHITR